MMIQAKIPKNWAKIGMLYGGSSEDTVLSTDIEVMAERGDNTESGRVQTEVQKRLKNIRLVWVCSWVSRRKSRSQLPLKIAHHACMYMYSLSDCISASHRQKLIDGTRPLLIAVLRTVSRTSTPYFLLYVWTSKCMTVNWTSPWLAHWHLGSPSFINEEINVNIRCDDMYV